MKKALIPVLVIAIIALVFWALPKEEKKTSIDIPPQNSSSLLINTDKAVYKPTEQVYMQITANCSDKLELKVNEESLQVEKSVGCGTDINQPNFFAVFVPSVEGEYKISLKNQDNEVTESGFVVSNEDAPYSITRWGSNRVNMSQSIRYPVKLIVKVNKDFKGQLVETFPSSIKLEWYGDAQVKENTLTWDIDLKAGETKEFAYEFSAQNEASNLVFGKAKLIDGRRTIYEESKFWQVISNHD